MQKILQTIKNVLTFKMQIVKIDITELYCGVIAI